MEEGTLSFCVEGQFLGVAHRGLRGKKVIHEKYGNDDNGNDDDDGRQIRTILYQCSIKVKALGFVVPFAIFLDILDLQLSFLIPYFTDNIIIAPNYMINVMIF